MHDKDICTNADGKRDYKRISYLYALYVISSFMKVEPAAKHPVEQKKEKRRGKGRVALIVVLIVVLVGAYLFLTYGSLPEAVLTAKQLNSSTMISIMTQKINSASDVNLSYTGSIIVNGSDPELTFYYYKYDGHINSHLEIQHLSAVGNVSASVVWNNYSRSEVSCVIYNYTNPNSTQVCKNSDYPYSVYSQILGTLFNVSSVSNVHTTSYGLQSVSGQPCYDVKGSGSVDVNGTIVNRPGNIPSTFNFNTCLSAQYDVPLSVNVSVKLKTGGTIAFSIKNYGRLFMSSSI